MSEFPFPFVGAGDATYFEWAEVHVVFARPPTDGEQAEISDAVPPPLRDSIDFDGPFLMVASDQFAHLAMAEAYDAEGDDDLAEDSEEEFGRFFFAATSQVQKFNEDTERWLRSTHDACPILVAFRAEDWESGGTDLSEWHSWSLEQSATILDAFDRGPVSDDEHPGSFVLSRLLHVFDEEERPIPDDLRDIVAPGEPELAALVAGDGDGLFAALSSRRARLGPTLERLTDALDDPAVDAVEALLRFLDTMEKPPTATIQRLAEALLDIEGDADAMLRELAAVATKNAQGLAYLGYAAYRRVQAERWHDAMRLYDVLIEHDCDDLSLYNNALYAIMDDNTGLGVQRERAPRYIECARPHGPRNPAIFYNIACLQMELGDDEQVLHNCALALEHGYDKPEQIRDEAVFGELRDDVRFKALFE